MITKTREVNFEYLRILSMLMIIILHTMSHGGLNEVLHFGTAEYFFYSFIRALVYTGVDLFVLITGYYMSSSNLHLSKLIRFEFQLWFYSIFIFMFGVVFFKIPINFKNILCTFAPIGSNSYWFATTYFQLLLLTPLVNIAIDKMSRKTMTYIIIIMILFFSVVPTFAYWAKSVFSDGKDIFWFITLYVIAAYIRKYDIDCKYKVSETVRHIVVICFMTVVLDALLRWGIMLAVHKAPSKLLYYNNSPFVAMVAVLIFLWFKTFKFKSYSAMANIGQLTFGVYLLHDNNLIRKNIWDLINIPKYADNFLLCFMYIICISTLVFLGGTFIDAVRVKFFDVIRINKLSTAIENKINYWIDGICVKYKIYKN